MTNLEPCLPTPYRYVVCMAFSGNGQRLVVVTGDNRHTVSVFHWKSKTLIHADVGHNGQPPQVFGVAWNNFLKDRDGEGREVIPPYMFVTYGVKHLKFWTLELDDVRPLGDHLAAICLPPCARPTPAPLHRLRMGLRAAR